MMRETSAAIEIGGQSPPGDDVLNSCSFTASPTPSMHMQSYVNVHESILNMTNGHFPQDDARSDDNSSSTGTMTPLPIEMLPGEKEEDQAEFIGYRLFLTNYRLCIMSSTDQSICVVPLMTIEGLDFKDPVEIWVNCKDGKVYRVSASTHELAIHWHRRLVKCSNRALVGEAFAWDFATSNMRSPCNWLSHEKRPEEEKDICQLEWDRLAFDPDHFQICKENKDYKFVETYPEQFIVPKNMTIEQLEKVKDFRFLQRFPVVVWKCKETRSILLRSSQPRSGFLMWRNEEDEKLLECVVEYMKRYAETKPAEADTLLRILDARSYAAAWANRAKGGGFESQDNYKNTKTDFLGLPNIHHIRYAFTQLRNVLSAPGGIDQATYLQSIQATNWLQYIDNLLFQSNNCVDLLTVQGTSVLVHCSDGWDRTTQIVAFAKLIADDHYRTLEGFEQLIRREWIEFGHKFADRCGVAGTDTNERSPVFLQWLDGVWQLMRFNPTAFQFNQQYLMKLAQHVYSGLFGSFLFNSMSDAAKEAKNGKAAPISIFRFLGEHNEEVVNQVYDRGIKGRIQVKCGIQNMEVWKECYCTDVPVETVAVFDTCSPVTSPHSSRAELGSRDSTSSIPRCKSSDSLNSIGNTTDGVAGMTINGTMNGMHSESNGALNSIGEHHSPLDMTDSMLLTYRRENRLRSLSSRPKNMKEMIDSDGLVRFYDPEQERMRKQKKEYCRELQKKDATIRDLERHRSISERTSASNCSKDSGRMASVGEQEYDNLSMDRMSDIVMVDSNDAPAPSSKGWDVSNSKCAECARVFSKLAISLKDRPHHCRSCGQTVCEDCSPNKFHSIHEGQSVLERACNSCYDEMKVRQSAEEEPRDQQDQVAADENGTVAASGGEAAPAAVGHARPHLHIRQNGGSFRNSCASQAVKG